MPNTKDIARIADRKEKERTAQVKEKFNQQVRFTDVDIFGSEEIPKILEEKPISFTPSLSEAYASLPLNSLLYSKIVVEICSRCLGGNASLIKPYLERGLILPILSQPLATYRSDFIDLVLEYPYISSESLDVYRMVQPCRECHDGEKGEALECPHNPNNYVMFNKYCKKITKNLVGPASKKPLLKEYKRELEVSAFPSLYPLDPAQYHLLQQLDETTSQKRFDLIHPLTIKAFEIYGLRLSKSFEAVPQISLEDLHSTNTGLNRLKISFNPSAVEDFEEKKWVTEALGLRYDSKMPIEEYLDIIIPRRKKINSLINSFISRKGTDLQNSINDEIWKTNEELASSKTIETLNYLTTFTSNNAGLISGLILGGLLGYTSASLIGCGFEGIASTVGSVSASTLAKIAQKREVTRKLHLPKPPRRTVEWLKEKMETQEEKMLARMLAKEIPIIQVWSLRKKLEKYSQK